MKIILLQDVEKLGKKFDVKEVADGHARNFLFPQGLAKPASKENMDWLLNQKELAEKIAGEELKQIGLAAARLDGLELEIFVRVGDKGQLFEKVNINKIIGVLKEKGFNVNKNQIDLKQEIDELGDFEAKVKFEHGLESQIKIIVAEEK